MDGPTLVYGLWPMARPQASVVWVTEFVSGERWRDNTADTADGGRVSKSIEFSIFTGRVKLAKLATTMRTAVRNTATRAL